MSALKKKTHDAEIAATRAHMREVTNAMLQGRAPGHSLPPRPVSAEDLEDELSGDDRKPATVRRLAAVNPRDR